jgi:hypothetical protein
VGTSARFALAGPRPTDVEVIDGGKRAVDRRRAALEHGLQIAAVVAYRPVSPVGGAERIALELGARQPREVPPDLRDVRATRLLC